MKIYDAAVIGAGPAGITAALYLVRSGCSVVLLEKLTPGGQVLLTDSMENYPGFPKGIKGWELADTFAAHLDGLALDRSTADVLAIEGEGGNFTVKTSAGDLSCRTVVVASGAHHRALGLENEASMVGHGVSYCAICDGNFYRNMPVAVIGGGNSALEEALYLSRIASRVYIVHRRDEFRGSQVFQDKIRATENIELVLSSTPTSFNGSPNLTSITVTNVKDQSTREIPVDGVFIFVGMQPNTGFLPGDVTVDRSGFVVTDVEMRTNVPGIFAAGDVRSKLCRQVVTAAGDGATAAQAAFLYLEQLHA